MSSNTTAIHPGEQISPQDRAFLTTPVIAVIAFLTVVDLFATQAILPSLAQSYGVSPAAMGVAVNAATFGMAFAGLACVFLPATIDRRRWIAGALVLLALPTASLALMPSLPLFTVLRIAQGLCMATAFTLTLAYLGEACSVRAASAAFAAYITGNVASNLIGRFVSATLAEGVGLAGNFLVFAALNLAGAILVCLVLQARLTGVEQMAASPRRESSWSVWRAHLRNRSLLAILGLGFCILFVFLGTFTYVNFLLVRPPFSLAQMSLGLVTLVFIPAVFTTPLAGRAVASMGRRRALFAGLAVAACGLPLLVLPGLTAVLAGLVLVGVGTFLAQAVATGAVGGIAMHHRTAASGMYLGAYYIGGLIGTTLLGLVFVHHGWPATVIGLGLALTLAAWLAARLPKDVSP